MARRVVAICGRIGSGKSTLAARLRNAVDANVVIVSFAQEAKRYARELFNVEIDGPMKNRAVIQRFAESMKAIDKDIWVKKTRDLIIHHDADWVIIDDLRFPNELAMLRELGAIVLRLNVTPETQTLRIRETYVNAAEHIARLEHVSEQHVDNLSVDVDIEENYDLDDVLKKIMKH
jgi:dephospho-CoA kinase